MGAERLKQITAWVEPDLKASFQSVVIKHGTKESKLLKRIVETFLKRNPSTDMPEAGEPTGLKDKRVTVRLTLREEQELGKRSKSRLTTRAAYLASLFRAHITQAPVFSENELVALREANRQLAALGKNVNQIAKALNISLDNAHLARAVELDRIKHELDKHRETVRNLVLENMKTWGG